ncbi:MAG: DUF3791 domain-containing protein [Duncaniella sp.]|nr:DUF3791 domain-containing protein [Duncaniella sp.]
MEGLQTILQMKYARIVNGIAEKLGISLEEALDRMYNSETFKLIDGKIADLHCRSDLYLIDEFINEWKEKGDLPE